MLAGHRLGVSDDHLDNNVASKPMDLQLLPVPQQLAAEEHALPLPAHAARLLHLPLQLPHRLSGGDAHLELILAVGHVGHAHLDLEQVVDGVGALGAVGGRRGLGLFAQFALFCLEGEGCGADQIGGVVLDFAEAQLVLEKVAFGVLYAQAIQVEVVYFVLVVILFHRQTENLIRN